MESQTPTASSRSSFPECFYSTMSGKSPRQSISVFLQAVRIKGFEKFRNCS